MIELLSAKIVTYTLFLAIVSALQIDRKSQFIYIIGQELIELLEIREFILMKNILGEWIFYILTTTLYILYIYDKQKGERKTRENPFILELKYGTKEYLIQVATFSLLDFEHPSLTQFEPLTIKKDGSISKYQKMSELKEAIWAVLSEIRDKRQVQLVVNRIKNPADIYSSYELYLYSIHDEMGDISNTFDLIENLDLKFENIKRINFKSLSRKKIKNCFHFNSNINQITIDTVNLSKLVDPIWFEIGIYEMDIFWELIDDYNEENVSTIIHGEHYLGDDIYRNPVNINQPSSTIYLGRERYIPQIMNFEYYNNCVLFTDDPDLIDGSCEYFPDITPLDINNLYLNIINLNRNEPKFFRKLLSLYEELIPDSIKPGYRSRQVTGKLIEFVELSQLYDPELNLHTKDLLSKKTYREFSADISTDVFVKYQEVFSLPLFNIKNNSLLKLMNTRGRKIISLEGLENKEKLAISLLLLVLKDQMITSNQVIISLVDHKLDFESKLSRLVRELELNDTMVHLRKIGNRIGWIPYFDMFLCDARFIFPKLKETLFDGLHNVNHGIYLNHEFRDKTILEVLK